MKQVWTAYVGLAMPFFSGCVSTDVGQKPQGLPCLETEVLAEPSDSLVVITVQESLTYDICPGVVIAPSLVATTASCLFPEVGEMLNLDEAPSCNTENGSPSDEGNFSSWISREYEVDDITVWSHSVTESSAVPVQRVYTSGTTSRCANDLAIAFVPQGAPGVAAPVRIEDSTYVGEQVTLAALHAPTSSIEPNETPAMVERVTTQRGDEIAPPGSLLLGGQVCFFARGGGVFASDTNALIGIILWGSRACDDPEGETVAIRLAPLRRFLIEAANDAQEEPLRAEPSPSLGLLPCPAETRP
jgi:hypothetical protein